MGENREPGALISYYVKDVSETEGKKPKAIVEIYNMDGQHLRTLKHSPKAGVNRLVWELDVRAVRYPDDAKPKPEAGERGGREVVPGDYLVKVIYGQTRDSVTIKVLKDPRLEISQEEMIAKAALIDRHYDNVAAVTKQVDRLRDASETLVNLKKLMKDKEEMKPLLEQADSLQAKIDGVLSVVLPDEDIQGIYRDDDLLQTILSTTGRYLQTVYFPLTPTQEYRVDYAEEQAGPVLEKIDAFFKEDWANFREMVDQLEINLLQLE